MGRWPPCSKDQRSLTLHSGLPDSSGWGLGKNPGCRAEAYPLQAGGGFLGEPPRESTGPQPAEAAVNRARSVEAPETVGRVPVCVCDLEENTPPRLPKKTEVEGEGCREREQAQGSQQRPGAALRRASWSWKVSANPERGGPQKAERLRDQLTGTHNIEPLTSCS